MNLEQLLEEWEKDSNFDSVEPDRAILKIPKLHAKYLKHLINNNLKLKQVKDEHARVRKVKWNYYAGNYNQDKDFLKEKGWLPFKMILKQDIDKYMDADEDIINSMSKVKYHEEITKALEYMMADLKGRGFNLKSYMDWHKFLAGQ